MHGEQNSTSAQRVDAVRQLDAFLNHHILTGPPKYERRWWAVKVSAKRHLAALPEAEANATAARLLREIIGGGPQL
jgi:hypothetical protein